MTVESKIRKWGNSYGVLIPKAEIEKMSLHESEKVLLDIKKKPELEQLFGICRFKKPTKELIREIREGYDD